MAEVIKMPRLSDTMAEGVIVSWNKKVGDKVKPGDVLADVETDKATMELESYNEGTLLYIGVEAGKAVKVDGLLAIIGKEGEDFKKLLESNQTATEVSKTENASTPTAKVESANASLPEGAKVIRMPLLSDTMTEGKIVSWNKKIGDLVKSDDVLAEVETDKATMEVVGYEEGTLLYIGVDAGNAAKINEIIAIIGKKGTDVSAFVAAEKSGISSQAVTTTQKATVASSPNLEKTSISTTEPSAASGDDRIKASPLAKKIAAEKGIDISKLNGSGDGGRIIKKDVDEYVTAASSQKNNALGNV
ncbi:MAG: pyruvate dehydrogenase, partial [Ferruginibacter sp.]|nr:pyruvate dehydrogenase [Ferruginibacter sp.]